jgi:hypothetical protein
MKCLSIYLTPTHASFTFQNGVTRETSATSFREVIDNLDPLSFNALIVFAHAVINHADTMSHETPARPDASFEKLLGS